MRPIPRACALRGEGAGRDQQAAHGAAHAHGVREFADVAGTGVRSSRPCLDASSHWLAVAFERDVGLVRGGARVVHAVQAAPGEHVEDQVDELAPAHARERGVAFGAFLARQAHALQVDGRGLRRWPRGDDDREAGDWPVRPCLRIRNEGHKDRTKKTRQPEPQGGDARSEWGLAGFRKRNAPGAGASGQAAGFALGGLRRRGSACFAAFLAGAARSRPFRRLLARRSSAVRFSTAGEVGEILAAGHAELGQRLLHARLEHLLELVPGVGGAFAGLAHVVPTASRTKSARPPAKPRAVFPGFRPFHQRLEQLGALGLPARPERAPTPASQIRCADSVRVLTGDRPGPTRCRRRDWRSCRRSS